MSWRFSGLIFENQGEASFESLLERLKGDHHRRAGAATFLDAIRRDNEATAVGFVNGRTMLLDHFLPFDCSYVPGRSGPLDEKLAPLSLEGDILNFIVDGVSGTYCFSLFSQGRRIRRWATLPDKLLCDEGRPLLAESQPPPGDPTPEEDQLPIFTVEDDEAHLFAVWEALLGLTLQELVQDDRPLFQLFQ